jgi:hypothetical protein
MGERAEKMSDYRSFETDFLYDEHTNSPNLRDVSRWLLDIHDKIGGVRYSLEDVWSGEWTNGRIRVGVKVEIEE